MGETMSHIPQTRKNLEACLEEMIEAAEGGCEILCLIGSDAYVYQKNSSEHERFAGALPWYGRANDRFSETYVREVALDVARRRGHANAKVMTWAADPLMETNGREPWKLVLEER